MAVNRTKVLEAAQKFLSKGQYDKAIAEYQKLVVEDPRDVRTLLKIGDLHTRRNKPKDAIDVYEKVAELYAKQGFFLKAVAVYKQILKLDADASVESTLKLAQMYEELALAERRAQHVRASRRRLPGAGETQKALETMERMIRSRRSERGSAHQVRRGAVQGRQGQRRGRGIRRGRAAAARAGPHRRLHPRGGATALSRPGQRSDRARARGQVPGAQRPQARPRQAAGLLQGRPARRADTGDAGRGLPSARVRSQRRSAC